MSYQRDPVTAPRLRGVPLRLFVETLESPLARSVIGKITRDSGLERFRATPAGDAAPLQVSLPIRRQPSQQDDPLALAERFGSREYRGPGPHVPETIARLAAAYRRGEAAPSEVSKRIIDGISELNRGEVALSFFIASNPQDLLAQAEASTRRFREGKPLSMLDGVPVAVKDEIDQAGYPTTAGTSFLGKSPAARDATIVRRLREAGALLIGKTHMHELGINPIGINPHHGAARNPYDRRRITGGSSSGSAAAVAAGVCPVALGGDGGGSVRIPAGLCGVVGLKPTFGRMSSLGGFPLCWHVGHYGVIGATVHDVAAAYVVTAGADPEERFAPPQPAIELEDLEHQDLKGVRLGLARPHFEDADPVVVRRCEEVVRACVAAGAEVVDVPPPDLNVVLWAHTIIILSEMATNMLPHLREDSSRFGLDARTNLAIGQYFQGTDYVHALRHRAKLTREYLELMERVDAIVTPTTATAAPLIPEVSLPAGESDLPLVDALMRFIRIGNLTGFPALAVPAGYDDQELPVSCHFLGRPWEEGLLLRIGAVAEAAIERRRPAHFVSLLR